MAAALMLPLLAACGGSSADPSATGAVSGPVGGAGFVGPEWARAAPVADSDDLAGFGITI